MSDGLKAKETRHAINPGSRELESYSSIIGVVGDLRAGSEQAQELVFKAFYQKLVKAAEEQLDSMPRKTGDAEVAASSTLRSFFSNMQKETLDFQNRKSIRGFLLHTLAEKVLEQRRRAAAAKRRESDVVGESSVDSSTGEKSQYIEDIAADVTSQEMATITKDFFDRLHARLTQREKQVLAKLVDGDIQIQIASQLNVSLRTVEATVASIRTKARRIRS